MASNQHERGRDGRQRSHGKGEARNRSQGGAYRVGTEISAVEKALTKSDFVSMEESLRSVHQALRGMRLRSLDALESAIKGKLITTLARVSRAPRPAEKNPSTSDAASEVPGESAEVPAPADEVSATAPLPTREALASTNGEGSNGEPPPATTGVSQESGTVNEAVELGLEGDRAPNLAGSPSEGIDAPTIGSESSLADGSPPVLQPAPGAAATESQQSPWEKSQYVVGLIWSSMNEGERASSAFARSGKDPEPQDLAPHPPDSASEAATAPSHGRPKMRPASRRETRSADSRRSARSPNPRSVDASGAMALEKAGAFAEASAMFEAEGDLESALRCAARVDDATRCIALASRLSPPKVASAYRAAQSWQRLMDYHAALGDYEAVAQLYERARQYDQAGLAWERAQKFGSAKVAFERAGDLVSANRVRDRDVEDRLRRGDRVGAAAVLMSVGRKSEALKALEGLPPAQIIHAMQRLKLHEEATAYSRGELARAQAAGDLARQGQWLEVLGNRKEAIERYLEAGLRDRAARVHAKGGDYRSAAKLMAAANSYRRAAEYFQKAGDGSEAQRMRELVAEGEGAARTESAAATMSPTEQS